MCGFRVSFVSTLSPFASGSSSDSGDCARSATIWKAGMVALMAGVMSSGGGRVLDMDWRICVECRGEWRGEWRDEVELIVGEV